MLDVAGVLAFAPRWVEQLAARCNAHGPEALGDRRNGRAASVSPAALLTALAGRRGTPPEDGGRWTGEGGLVDGAPTRGGAGASAARLGSFEAGAVTDPNTPSAVPAFTGARAASGVQRGFDAAVAQARAAHPAPVVGGGAEGEHRLGLKPIRRRVRAPIGERPRALGHHSCKRLHVTAFVQPTSGEAVWFLSTGLSKPLLEKLPATFARDVGAGRERHIVLVLDNAGWHGPKNLAVPPYVFTSDTTVTVG